MESQVELLNLSVELISGQGESKWVLNCDVLIRPRPLENVSQTSSLIPFSVSVLPVVQSTYLAYICKFIHRKFLLQVPGNMCVNNTFIPKPKVLKT